MTFVPNCVLTRILFCLTFRTAKREHDTQNSKIEQLEQAADAASEQQNLLLKGLSTKETELELAKTKETELREKLGIAQGQLEESRFRYEQNKTKLEERAQELEEKLKQSSADVMRKGKSKESYAMMKREIKHQIKRAQHSIEEGKKHNEKLEEILSTSHAAPQAKANKSS